MARLRSRPSFWSCPATDPRPAVGRAAELPERLSFPVDLVPLPILRGFVAPVHSSLAARCDSSVADVTAFALSIVGRAPSR
jgi:hypothetical protein